MAIVHLTGKEELISKICRAAFPDYNGKKFSLRTAETVQIRSHWSGGSIEIYAFVDLATLTASKRMEQGPVFNPGPGQDIPLPDGVALVTHTRYCGKDMGISITVNPRTMNPNLLPAKAELSDDEERVLFYTRSLKPSYNGISEYRQYRSGLDSERWNSAKAALIQRGLLNKAGAITVQGKNALTLQHPKREWRERF